MLNDFDNLVFRLIRDVRVADERKDFESAAIASGRLLKMFQTIPNPSELEKALIKCYEDSVEKFDCLAVMQN